MTINNARLTTCAILPCIYLCINIIIRKTDYVGVLQYGTINKTAIAVWRHFCISYPTAC